MVNYGYVEEVFVFVLAFAISLSGFLGHVVWLGVWIDISWRMG